MRQSHLDNLSLPDRRLLSVLEYDGLQDITEQATHDQQDVRAEAKGIPRLHPVEHANEVVGTDLVDCTQETEEVAKARGELRTPAL